MKDRFSRPGIMTSGQATRILALTACLAAGLLAAGCMSGPDATGGGSATERLTLASRSVDGLGEAAGGGTPLGVPATLYLPQGAGPAGRVPAVAILHGGGGKRAAREDAFARDLARAGVAALVIDSFGARDLSGGDAIALMRRANIADQAADAAAARAALAAHPAIDPGRIVLAGTSLGGWTTLAMADSALAEPLDTRFAGYAALYTPCSWRPGVDGMVTAPVLLLAGRADSSVDPEACTAMEQAMRAAGAAPTLVLYDGAAHTYIHEDLPAGSVPFPLALGCRFTPGPGGTIREAATGRTAATDDGFIEAFLACAERGKLTAGGNAAARRDALRRIVALARAS